jgi:peptidoglycan hydrolase-like protein with peptidoglycan-binding domain
MFRTLAFAAALAAAGLSTRTLAAQSTATKPAMKQAPAQSVKVDTGKTGASAVTAAKPTPARHAAWTKDQIKEAQQGLAKAGFYKGTATGIWNKDTKNALKEFQKENKMPVTGRLSDSVLVKLKSA